jgi:hypothetical protein
LFYDIAAVSTNQISGAINSECRRKFWPFYVSLYTNATKLMVMSFVFSVIHFCDFKIVPCGWLPFAQLAYITVYAANTNNISYQHIQVVQLAIYSLPQTIMLPACVVATKTL